MKLSDWFKGFEKGIARLSPEQRSAFFSECGKNCVDGAHYPFTGNSMRMLKGTWMFSFSWRMDCRE